MDALGAIEFEGDSVEVVAYALLLQIANVEGKLTYDGSFLKDVDRKWIIDTFIEARKAVAGAS